MCSSMWFLRIVALLVVDVRTGALQDRGIQPSVCHSCYPANGTECADFNAWPSVKCPDDRPLCATVASAPDFTSVLTCAASAKTPCLLHSSPNNLYVFTCICRANNCNTPFTHEIRNELLNFSYTGNNSDMTNVFLKSSKFANISDGKLYKELTVTATTIEVTTTTEVSQSNTSQLTTKLVLPARFEVHLILKDSEKPKAEALKQAATVPSDDDEDENEGSGNYEERRSHSHSASAPAAPSSYLPADGSATPLSINLSALLLLVYFIV